MGLKVGGQTYHSPPPQSKKWGGGAHAPLAPLFLRQCTTTTTTTTTYYYYYYYYDYYYYYYYALNKMLSSVLFPDTDNLKPWRCLRNVVLFHTAPCGVAIMLGVVTIYQVGPDTPVINFNTASLISLGSLVRITCLCVRVLL